MCSLRVDWCMRYLFWMFSPQSLDWTKFQNSQAPGWDECFQKFSRSKVVIDKALQVIKRISVCVPSNLITRFLHNSQINESFQRQYSAICKAIHWAKKKMTNLNCGIDYCDNIAKHANRMAKKHLWQTQWTKSLSNMLLWSKTWIKPDRNSYSYYLIGAHIGNFV